MNILEKLFKIKDLAYVICLCLDLQTIVLIPFINKFFNKLCLEYNDDKIFKNLLDRLKYRGDEWMYLNSILSKDYAEESRFCRHLKHIFFERFTTQKHIYTSAKLYWIREWLGLEEKELFLKEYGYLDGTLTTRTKFLVSLWETETFLPFIQRDEGVNHAIKNNCIVVSLSSSVIGCIRLILSTKNVEGKIYCMRIRVLKERHEYNPIKLHQIIAKEVEDYIQKHSIKNEIKVSSYCTNY